MTTLIAALALLAGLCAIALLRRWAWIAAGLMVACTALGLLLLHVAAARPLPGPPPAEFILWAWAGEHSWLSTSEDGSPMTYAWQPPPAMRAALEQGPLRVGPRDDAKGRKGTMDRSEGEWRFAPLEIVGGEKP